MSDIRAIKITHDGAVSRVTLHQDGDSSTLQAMYEQIECHTVDCIGLDQDMDMWIDDEGKFVEPSRSTSWRPCCSAPCSRTPWIGSQATC